MLQVFIPSIPIVPVAIVVILFFVILNIGGGAKVGNAQIVLGLILLLGFAAFIILGFLHSRGFSWQTFMPDGKLFIFDTFGKNLSRMLATIALIYNAYVGFEVIVDDAEEVSNPGRTIQGILMPTWTTVIYAAVALVAQGTIPWRSRRIEQPLTDVVDASRAQIL